MKQETREAVVIPITGAFNPSLPRPRVSRHGIDWTVSNPFGKSSFQRIGESLETDGITCEDPIVLRDLGLRDPEHTHEQVTKQVQRRMERHDGALFLFIGHSLGGVILAGLLEFEQFQQEVAGGIAAGSPFDGVNNTIFGPAAFAARVAGQESVQEQIEKYAAVVCDSRQKTNGAAVLHIVGSPHDRIVPLASAIHTGVNATSTTVFGPDDARDYGHGANRHSTLVKVGHMNLLTNWTVATAIAELAADTLTSDPINSRRVA